jgi:outer membrane protein assembly factor BamB
VSQTNTTPCWKTKPVSGGTVSQMLISSQWAWVGGSDGKLYQLDISTGAVNKTLTVGTGTLALGPVSTETTNELYVASSDGTAYKIALTNGSLP